MRKFIIDRLSLIIPRRSVAGFTMVELLVYMGIFSILLLVLMQLFGAILATHAESQATSGLSQDGNYILSRLSYDIRNATATSISVTSPTQLQMTVNGVATTVSLSGNTLSEVVGGTSYALNSVNTNVGSVAFIKLGNATAGSKPTVQILLTLKSTTLRPGSTTTQSETFETTTGTRQ